MPIALAAQRRAAPRSTGSASARPAHAATVVQKRAAPATAVSAKPPHPATTAVIQKRAAPTAVSAKPPHPATIAAAAIDVDADDPTTSLRIQRAEKKFKARKGKGKGKADKARQHATIVLGDFQAYGASQYAQVIKAMQQADFTESQAQSEIIRWIMAHQVWGKKKNLGHQSQKRGAPMHEDTIAEVNGLRDDLLRWIEKKKG